MHLIFFTALTQAAGGLTSSGAWGIPPFAANCFLFFYAPPQRHNCCTFAVVFGTVRFLNTKGEAVYFISGLLFL